MLLAEKNELPQNEPKFERTNSAIHHLLGSYVFPKRNFNVDSSVLHSSDYDNYSKADLEIVAVKCNINLGGKVISDLQKQMNEDKPLSASAVDQLIQLSVMPTIMPLRLVN